ncbi:MAG: AAA family ATPase [Ornithinimicrobium sp.]
MSVETRDLVAAEIAREQQHVDLVYRELVKAGVRVELVHAEGLARGRTERQGTGEPREEELTGLFERDALVFAATKRRATLQDQHEGLVFGRLDLQADHQSAHRVGEEQANGRHVRYIGRLGVRDDDYEPLVIDWRAPAAAPFYRATPVQPHGVIRRRVLRCRGVEVIGVEDDLMVPDAPEGIVVIGDGALIAALARSRGERMRDIVATIQQHQDEAIRAPARGVTEITGGPGTGKTVVALHRAAYLLYADRRRFEAGGVLVVGPSAGYTAYIERVLPSLGEDSVTLRSLGDVVGGITAHRLDRPHVAAIKGSLRMRPLLSRLAKTAVPTAPTVLRCFVAGWAIRLESGDLGRARRQALRRHHRNNARSVALAALTDLAWAQVGDPNQDRAAFVEKFADSRDVDTFLEAWWPQLDAREVLRWLGDDSLAAAVAGPDVSQQEASALAEAVREAENTGMWSVADAALIDELATTLGPMTPPTVTERDFYEIEELDDSADPSLMAQRLNRSGSAVTPDGLPERPSQPGEAQRVWTDPLRRLMSGNLSDPDEYAHVLVDEAQDVSPMQWRMLGRRGRTASWTVVGDHAQASWPDLDESAQARDVAFGRAPRRSFHMDTNYRNAKEIFDVAQAMIRKHVPDADIPVAVRETGDQPVDLVLARDNLEEALSQSVREALRHVDGSVAIIAPQRWMSQAQQAAGTQLTSGADTGAQHRVVAVDPLASKGLEYDATVVLDPDEIVAESPGGARVLYVVLTRAAHRMTVLRPQ